ncbi:hypothetical protein [Nocardia acidivorans]|uniref:hypothetical protein n=1 Tax=Nocardia acidivorans TaxID=404580 RepID=UPI00082FBBA9|nr:hypothetical protein [Nocardia acidivorans]
MSNHNRTEAERMIGAAERADVAAAAGLAGIASAHALLAVEDRLSQLVDIANAGRSALERIAATNEVGVAINAAATGVGTPTPASRVTAEAWIRAQILEIVTPPTNPEENTK